MTHPRVLLILHHAPDRTVVLAKTCDYILSKRIECWGADVSRWPILGPPLEKALQEEMPAYGIFAVRLEPVFEDGEWDFRVKARHLTEVEEGRLLDGKTIWEEGEVPLREDLYPAPPWLKAREK